MTKLLTVLIGSVVFCASMAMTTSWQTADARSKASAGRTSHAHRSAHSYRARLRPFRRSADRYRDRLRPLRRSVYRVPSRLRRFHHRPGYRATLRRDRIGCPPQILECGRRPGTR
jgi:hypothetical protein